MYSPKQLYLEFSSNYCDYSEGTGSRNRFWGYGAKLDTESLNDLLKLMPHSTFTRYIKNIDNSTNSNYKAKFVNFVDSGKNQLSLPYKFLQILDPDAFKEIQITKKDGPAHAIRNACDVTRACDIFWKSRESEDPNIHYFYEWEGRGATEPMIAFCSNGLPESLFFCGPNFLTSNEAKYRLNGFSILTSNDPSTNEAWDPPPTITDGQLENVPFGMAGFFVCKCPPGGVDPPPCPCDCCDESAVIDPTSPECYKKPPGPMDGGGGRSRSPSRCVNKQCVKGDEKKVDENTFNYNNISSSTGADKDSIKIHAGYFIRKSYGGIGNFKTVGDYFGIDDLSVLLSWARSQNGFNYNTTSVDAGISDFNIFKGKRPAANNPINYPLKRVKSVSLVTEIEQIRDLLHNGYGLIFATNVGFSDRRDSIGIAYPNRLWYQTLAIIGCDDRKKLYPETLFLVQNSWGKWNYGGHPDWGPIPDGSFLITESHLRAIIGTNGGGNDNGIYNFEKFWDCKPPLERSDCRPSYSDVVEDIFFRPPTSLAEGGAQEWQPSIRNRSTTPVLYERVTCLPNAPSPIKKYTSYKACINDANREALLNCCGEQCLSKTLCDFTECGPNQKPWGYVMVASFEDEPPYIRKDMRYNQFFQYSSPEECECIQTQYGIVNTSTNGWRRINVCSTNSSIHIRFIFEDSTNCGGYNPGIQGGEISCPIKMPNVNKVRIRLVGNVEGQDSGFDKSEIYLGDAYVSIGSESSKNECTMTAKSSSSILDVIPGTTYVLRCKTSTIDGNYHKNMIHNFYVDFQGF